MMKHDDFRIGAEFKTGSHRWRCTDVGTRTIVAISITAHEERWGKGLPCMAPEIVFDERDFLACEAAQ